MNEARGSGRGKIILLGEHAVVHGEPAIATGLGHEVRIRLLPGGEGDPRVTGALRPAIDAAAAALGMAPPAALALEIAGDLPVAVGLGSSAALSVALVRALAASDGRALSPSEAARLANEVEKVFHGTPSGIDATTAAHGGLLWFETGPPMRWEEVAAGGPLPLVVALSGEEHDTGRSVGGLRRRAESSPEVYGPVFGAIGGLVRAGRAALEHGAWPLLGELMSMNHGLLRACGVSTEALDRVVDDALACGALGAKLTGAGGGGAAIALASPDGEADLVAALRRRGWHAFRALSA